MLILDSRPSRGNSNRQSTSTESPRSASSGGRRRLSVLIEKLKKLPRLSVPGAQQPQLDGSTSTEPLLAKESATPPLSSIESISSRRLTSADLSTSLFGPFPLEERPKAPSSLPAWYHLLGTILSASLADNSGSGVLKTDMRMTRNQLPLHDQFHGAPPHPRQHHPPARSRQLIILLLFTANSLLDRPPVLRPLCPLLHYWSVLHSGHPRSS
jgi:hypothetical protein